MLVFLAALCLASCDDYDDTSLWQKVNDHEERLAALEQWQEETNHNISAIQQLLNTTDCITAVTSLMEGGQEVGYTIQFLHSDPITIYHGQKGDTGDDGYTPQIGLTQGEDNNWYWTLDGRLMQDADGNPIRANGEDGKDGEDGQDGADGEDGSDGATGAQGKPGTSAPTPQIMQGSTIASGTIQTDNGTKQADAWYLSVDGGQTWYRISGDKGETGDRGPEGEQGPAGAEGDDGDTMFAEEPITLSEDGTHYIFTLVDGNTFEVPAYQALTIGEGATTDPTSGALIVASDNETTINLSYQPDGYTALMAQIISEDGTDTSISTRASGTGGWSVTADFENKTVAVTAPASGTALLDVTLVCKDGGKVTASQVVKAVTEVTDKITTINTAGDYLLTGSRTTGITISADNVNLTLQNASINVSDGPAISITGGTPTIHVIGEGNSVSSSNNTGIAVSNGATVTITGNSTADVLTAKGGTPGGSGSTGTAGAGIGSPIGGTKGGNITIRNVTIHATGGEISSNTGGAGIGSSSNGTCGDITIANAVIIATGGYSAAAIGMGCNSYDDNFPAASIGAITITNSDITASGGYAAAAIGFSACYTQGGAATYCSGKITITTDDLDKFLSCLTLNQGYLGDRIAAKKIGKGQQWPLTPSTFRNTDNTAEWEGVVINGTEYKDGVD